MKAQPLNVLCLRCCVQTVYSGPLGYADLTVRFEFPSEPPHSCPRRAATNITAMPQSYAGAYYHFIFSTRNWNRDIDDELAPMLYDYIGGIIRNHGGLLLAAGGVEDHIHLLATIPRDLSLSDAMRIIKSLSSGWIHRSFPTKHREFAWQAGYGVFTVSASNLKRVKRYIANQKEHHRTVTYQEEFIQFLVEYGVPYDIDTLWE